MKRIKNCYDYKNVRSLNVIKNFSRAVKNALSAGMTDSAIRKYSRFDKIEYITRRCTNPKRRHRFGKIE